jgi:hypothetical protein
VETSGRVGEDLRVAVKVCGKRHAACAWATWMMEEIIFELAGRMVGRELLLENEGDSEKHARRA